MEEEKTCINSTEQYMKASENSCIAGSEEEELIWAQKAITGYVTLLHYIRRKI